MPEKIESSSNISLALEEYAGTKHGFYGITSYNQFASSPPKITSSAARPSSVICRHSSSSTGLPHIQ